MDKTTRKPRGNSDAEKTVADFLRQYGVRDAAVTVALSGGADSMCLLDTLHRLRGAFDLSLYAIHVNHGIRGDEALRDETFCRAQCAARDIPLTVVHVDVPAKARDAHISLETAARNARYECFAAFRAAHPGTWIATAHTATDTAETVLFRLARGTGLLGLCGIPACRDGIIRPMLRLTREEVREEMKAAGVSYVEDSTNADEHYTRNYVRHTVLPAMERVHEGAAANISFSAGILSDDEAYLASVAETLLTDTPPGQLRGAIATAHPAIGRRAVRQLYEAVRRSPDAMTAEQVSDVLRLIGGGQRNASMSLPCGIVFTVGGGTVFCGEQPEAVTLPRQSLKAGVNVLTGRDACIIVSEKQIIPAEFPQMNIYKLLIQCTLSSDTIIDKLYIRQKADGDAYRYGGMTRKLKKLFCDRKLSPQSRAALPVLCDGDGILWVPGFGVRDGCAALGQAGLNICFCYMTEATK